MKSSILFQACDILHVVVFVYICYLTLCHALSHTTAKMTCVSPIGIGLSAFLAGAADEPYCTIVILLRKVQ